VSNLDVHVRNKLMVVPPDHPVAMVVTPIAIPMMAPVTIVPIVVRTIYISVFIVAMMIDPNVISSRRQ
jgi:hypothetical protein